MTVLTSPTICASQKFTFPSPIANGSGSNPSNSPSHTSAPTSSDYFSKVISPTTTTFSPAKGTTKHSQQSHKSINDSISSVTSNASDLTIFDFSSVNGSSTETLVDEKNPTKNKINRSFDFGNGIGKLLSFDEEDEIEVANSKIEGQGQGQAPVPVPASLPQFPHLKKQMTLPSITCTPDSINSIKSEQSKRLNFIPCQNFKPQIEKLSSRIKYISPLDIKGVLAIPNNLVLDIRPFADYIKSHVSGALNICLPSTLLKRVNFSLLRSIESLPNFEKLQFTKFLQDPKGGNLIVYDFHQNSSNLYHICLKIINCPLFHQLEFNIYLIDTNFTQFNKLYPSLFESGHSPPPIDEVQFENQTNLNNFLPPIIVPPTLKSRSQSLTDISPCYKSTPVSSTSSYSIEKTPVLQNFTLATKNKVFKLRHNEELLTPGTGPLIIPSFSSNMNPFEENSANLFRLHNIPSDKNILPQWIKQTIFDGNGESSTNIINENFYKLEKLEQKRLVSALSLSPSGIISSPLGEIPPKVSCGIEYGNKNRYKDIFLYDHSRVKLNDSNDDNIENYINASYIHTNPTILEELNAEHCNDLSYVATQGPLDGTMGDFWKCVYNLQTGLIISLTDEIENGIVKCSPFWKSGIYKSCMDSITVNLIEEETINENIVLRSFTIRKCEDEHKVLQIQLVNWPDMGAILDPQDIIQVVNLKQELLNKHLINSKFPTLVHCSAGCGRTGTFCTIDLMINILNQSRDLPNDPIFEIVNDFRKQRISMVQTLRQYYLIYEVLLIWLSQEHKSNELIDRDIVRRFINL